uniref:Uncharacterized protein n=1 Tax=Vespula pensylvanica TaxID=30213 RepID=A0A834KLT1_VESPE|nr:hypothetical protein H0235_013915 [Vespula pensylvanica]
MGYLAGARGVGQPRVARSPSYFPWVHVTRFVLFYYRGTSTLRVNEKYVEEEEKEEKEEEEEEEEAEEYDDDDDEEKKNI